MVWNVISTFDVSWHPNIVRCDLIRAEDGALVRNFTDTDGKVYEERRIYKSDTDRVLCYALINGIDGISEYAARIEVTEKDGAALVSWNADIRATSDRIEAISIGTKEVFENGLDALGSDPLMWPTVQPHFKKLNCNPNVTQIEGILTHSLRVGIAGQDDSETLVLFLHGIGGNATNWDCQIKALGSQYWIAALDLRGYGGSSLGSEPSQVDHYCEDILHVVNSLGAKRLVLGGLSYGSWIATSFALRHSDILAGLILAGGCTGMSEAHPRERDRFRISREVPLDAGQTPCDFAPAVVHIVAGPNATQQHRDELRSSMAAIPSATYRDALQCFTNPLERFDFSKIDCPVLMFTGEHDKLAPPHEIRRVSERIVEDRRFKGLSADVQFEIVQGAGHVCNLEAPDATNTLIHRFLSRLPGVACGDKPSLQERRREKRDRIRQAAHAEFCENGYDGASMDRVALRANVSKPTVYHYFGGKDALLEAVLEVGRTHIVAPLLSVNGSLVDRLWQFSWVYADFVLRPDMLSLARLILGEASRRPETAIAYHRYGPGRAFEDLVEFVQEAIGNGELATDMPDLAAQNLWSLILSGTRDRYLHYAEDRPNNAELSRTIGHGLEVFLKAYGGEPKAQVQELQSLISAQAQSFQNLRDHR